jgi:hypothetical protein
MTTSACGEVREVAAAEEEEADEELGLADADADNGLLRCFKSATAFGDIGESNGDFGDEGCWFFSEDNANETARRCDSPFKLSTGVSGGEVAVAALREEEESRGPFSVVEEGVSGCLAFEAAKADVNIEEEEVTPSAIKILGDNADAEEATATVGEDEDEAFVGVAANDDDEEEEGDPGGP